MEEAGAAACSLCESLLQVQNAEKSPESVRAGFAESLQSLIKLTDTLQKCPHTKHRRTLSLLTITAAAHCGQHYWTDSDTRQLAHDLLAKLVAWSGTKSLEDLLAGADGDQTMAVMKGVLPLLKERLTRDEWKKHPAHKQALFWCIRQLKHPNVSPYRDVFLPATLLVMDDHEDYHKTLALNTATHVIQNMDPSELRRYGRAEVLYEAMKPLLYQDAPEVINSLHHCLLTLLPVMDAPTAPTVPTKPNRTSEVFGQLLNSLQFESKLASRKAYVSHVSGYIQALGIQCVRHMKSIITALLSCMEFPDYTGEHTRLYALQAMATLVAHAWPRVPQHSEQILKGLLRLISDLCPSNTDIPTTPVVQSQLQLVCKCLSLLAAASPHNKDLYVSLKSSCQHRGLQYCLEQSLLDLDCP